MHFLIRAMPKQAKFPFLGTWDVLSVVTQCLLSVPDVSSLFIAHYTIVLCSSFNLILKCFHTKDMIKYEVLEALSTEVKLSTG